MTKSEKAWDGQAWFARFSDVCGVFAPNASEDIKRALSNAPSDLVSAPSDSRAWRTAFALGAELHFWRRAFAGEPIPSKLRDVKGGMWARNADGYLAPLMEPVPEDCEIDTPEKLYAWMRGYEYAAGVTLSEGDLHGESVGADDDPAGVSALSPRDLVKALTPTRVVVGFAVMLMVAAWAALPPILATPPQSGSLVAFSLPDSLEASIAEASGGALTVRETRFDADAGLNRVVIDDARESGRPLIGWSPKGRADVLILGRVLHITENRDLTAEAAERYLREGSRLMALIDTPVMQDASLIERPDLHADATSSAAPVGDRRDSDADLAGGALSGVLAWLDETPGAGIHWPELAGDKKLYVGVDPDCIHCHRYLAWLADHTTEFEQAGVTPVIVPVGFLTQASPGKAAAMIAGGIDAVWRNEAGFDPARGGGLAPVTEADAADAWAQMQANTTRLFRAAEAEGQSGGTPMLLWRAGNARDYLLVGDPGAEGMALILASFAENFTDTP